MGQPQLPIAGWHRGLSPNQIKAAKELKSALLFDLEEGTAHRIYDCVARIGVSPMINRQTLWRILQLSRGNHLSFLYFLVLEHYKSLSSAFTGQEPKYTVNEQILLSALAYLDMPTTFKELDRILPKNVKKPIEKPRPLRRNPGPKDNPNVLPYFKKQPRPKKHASSAKFICTPPSFVAQIGKDFPQDEEIEDSCWFATYKLQPIKRMIKSLIGHELKVLFDKIDEVRTPVSEPQIPEINKDRLEFLVKQRDRCLAMIDLEEERKLLSRERILRYLENDVQRYLQKFASLQPPSRDYVIGVGRVSPVERQVLQFDSTEEGNCRAGLTVKGSSIDDSSGHNELNVRVLAELDCANDFKIKSSSECPTSCLKKKKKIFQETSNTSLSNIQYFRAPKEHAPHVFNYYDLFNGLCRIKKNPGQIIREALVKALDKKSTLSPHWEELQRKTIQDAVSQCVHNIFQKGLLKSPQPKPEPVATNFDPNDEHLMEQMLYDALKKLRQNSTFVLASLPQSHQVPELREWIRRRYGKRYRAETIKEFNVQQQNFMKLTHMDNTLLPPSLSGRNSGNNYVSYTEAHDGQIFKNSLKYGQRFKNRLNNIILDRSRLCWHALHYLRTNNNDNLHRAYFSYIPGRVLDMLPTKGVWLSHN
ncbi:uncharacterized protein [Drosophila tropicalis]|uniref:uncharacterized protein n=1 Tax=Drosophila tropicalis TaxID=46794 RepID=UPI0035ABDE13